MKGIFHTRNIAILFLASILLAFCSAIIVINFCAAPSFFDADMYCDYRYAMEVWNSKSLFPEGWIFGNQLNVVSTPVLAALIYGLSQNPNFSIAAACTLMGFAVLISFDWMLKTVLKSLESRLLACLYFLSVVLFYGEAIYGNKGWTLFFTMCGYYAGYAITAFLVFGCYLRALNSWNGRHIPVFAVACIFSFGTGIQSIRQTVVMVVPLIAAELFRLMFSRRENAKNKVPTWIVGCVTVSNILGLLYIRLISINQKTIYGAINLASSGNILTDSYECFLAMLSLLSNGEPIGNLVITILFVICIMALLQTWIKKAWHTKKKGQLLSLLLGVSIPTIMFVDIFLTMDVRPRYYFMLFPLISYLVALFYDQCKKVGKTILVAFSVCFFLLSFCRELPDLCVQAVNREKEDSYAIADFLISNHYTTVYSTWDCAEDIVIASNGRLNVGFWYEMYDSFDKVEILCNPDVHNEKAEQCAYIFDGESAASSGISLAASKGITMELLKYYPNSDMYVYTSPVNLMSEVDW